jgi:hypothetical protein
MKSWIAVLLGLVLSSPAVAADVGKGVSQRPLNVLFIGNSYTFVNDLPGLVSALAEAGGQKIKTDQETPGGCTLKRHVEEGKAAKLIAQELWDVVVLQEHSLGPIKDPQQMQAYARQLDARIRARGAKTVFYLTWARQNTPQTQATLNKAYFAIARELHAEVAPVGMAWQRALTADPKLELHQKDHSHPTPQGSYLAACVFYGTLLGKSPEGLPGQLKRGSKTLVSIEPALAKRLQQLAWKTVQEERQK